MKAILVLHLMFNAQKMFVKCVICAACQAEMSSSCVLWSHKNVCVCVAATKNSMFSSITIIDWSTQIQTLTHHISHLFRRNARIKKRLNEMRVKEEKKNTRKRDLRHSSIYARLMWLQMGFFGGKMNDTYKLFWCSLFFVGLFPQTIFKAIKHAIMPQKVRQTRTTKSS